MTCNKGVDHLGASFLGDGEGGEIGGILPPLLVGLLANHAGHVHLTRKVVVVVVVVVVGVERE